jgi:hypothetical protein
MSPRLFLSIMLLFVLVSFLFVGSVGASSELWSQTYGGESYEKAYSLVESSDGGFALAGTKNNDFWLAKTDAQGIPEFPSWIILPLFLMATFVGVIFKKRLSQSVKRCTK